MSFKILSNEEIVVDVIVNDELSNEEYGEILIDSINRYTDDLNTTIMSIESLELVESMDISTEELKTLRDHTVVSINTQLGLPINMISNESVKDNIKKAYDRFIKYFKSILGKVKKVYNKLFNNTNKTNNETIEDVKSTIKDIKKDKSNIEDTNSTDDVKPTTLNVLPLIQYANPNKFVNTDEPLLNYLRVIAANTNLATLVIKNIEGIIKEFDRADGMSGTIVNTSIYNRLLWTNLNGIMGKIGEHYPDADAATMQIGIIRGVSDTVTPDDGYALLSTDNPKRAYLANYDRKYSIIKVDIEYDFDKSNNLDIPIPYNDLDKILGHIEEFASVDKKNADSLTKYFNILEKKLNPKSYTEDFNANDVSSALTFLMKVKEVVARGINTRSKAMKALSGVLDKIK